MANLLQKHPDTVASVEGFQDFEDMLDDLISGLSPHIIVTKVRLSTIYHIDGITAIMYGCHHHTVQVLSRFELYMATAQLTPYFTIFYACKYGYHCLPVLHYYDLLKYIL